MVWTLCTSGAVIVKAGANVNSTIIASGSSLARWSEEAEAAACNVARYDAVTNFGSLNTQGKQIFQEYCSSHIAQKIIGYEPETIGSTAATLRLNIMENNMNRAQQQIKDGNIKTYLNVI